MPLPHKNFVFMECLKQNLSSIVLSPLHESCQKYKVEVSYMFFYKKLSFLIKTCNSFSIFLYVFAVEVEVSRYLFNLYPIILWCNFGGTHLVINCYWLLIDDKVRHCDWLVLFDCPLRLNLGLNFPPSICCKTTKIIH